MATSREIIGPTPNGGVRSEAIFLDKDRQLVDESVATHVEIVEYDVQGEVVARTYGETGRGSPTSNEGDNCGIGADGFQPGNTCAKGDGGTSDKSKFIGAKVGKAEHVHSAKVEQEVAAALGGTWEEDNAPYDVIKGKDGFEVKSLLKGGKQSLSVHDDALLRKVNWQAQDPTHTFHTVAVDERESYEGGAYKENFSGHRMYYKRGSGRYALSQMHPVGSAAELKRLVRMSDADLPERARGSLPTGDAVEKLRANAEKAHASRLAKDRTRKARIKAEKKAGGA